MSSENARSTGLDLAISHNSVNISIYGMGYFLAVKFVPFSTLKRIVEFLQLFCIYEIDESIANVTVVLHLSMTTFMSNGKYKKS